MTKTPKPKPAKYFWTIIRQESYQGTRYAHVHIQLYLAPPPEAEYHRREPIFSIQWQSDSDQSPPKWYCPHLEVRAHSDVGLTLVQQLETAARLARQFPFDWDPVPYLNSLVAANIERRIWDNRVDRYVKPRELLPLNQVVWIARVDRKCIVKCLAEDVEPAQDAAARALGERIANSGKHYCSVAQATREFAEWMAAGRPVERDRWGEPSEVQTLDELLKPFGKPAEVQTPAPAEEAAAA